MATSGPQINSQRLCPTIYPYSFKPEPKFIPNCPNSASKGVVCVAFAAETTVLDGLPAGLLEGSIEGIPTELPAIPAVEFPDTMPNGTVVFPAAVGGFAIVEFAPSAGAPASVEFAAVAVKFPAKAGCAVAACAFAARASFWGLTFTLNISGFNTRS